MKNFMIAVLENITPEVASQLQSEENEIVGGWREKGIIQSVYFRADGKGLYGVMQAESPVEVHERMKTLPFYPYMKLDIVELK